MAKAERKPVYQSVFGASWGALSPVFHKRYANRAHSRDTVVLKGTMRFEASRLARLLSPFMHFNGMVPMFSAESVPATVQICSQQENAAVRFAREFAVEGRRKPVRFETEVQTLTEGEVVDWTNGDIGWHAAFTYQENALEMAHRGYRLRLFGKTFRLPLEGLIGTCTAWEKAENDNRFSMRMEMRRRNGKLFYAYSGEFDIAGVMRRD